MHVILGSDELATRFAALAERNGETIWNRQIIIGQRRFSYPLMNTSWLARHFKKGSLTAHDPNAWVVEEFGEQELRLYLRVGEEYGEGWSQQLTPPVRVAIKSLDQFVVMTQLPRRDWWQAEFVCPFCDTMCIGQSHCSHLLISHHIISENLRRPTIVSLLDEMRNRMFNCNMLNANIEGLKIKLPRNFVGGEWFRFAYWFILTPDVLDGVERVLIEGKNATYFG